MIDLRLGDVIQHVSGVGKRFEVVQIRPDHGDAVAITADADPVMTRVINFDNWKVVGTRYVWRSIKR